ncbi:hypothetical protein BDR07DRAFT_1373951 [Suillus spraguei]|nr:hypothetical protein BDR07DRAFT_1373951 [Suillus spraguei]
MFLALDASSPTMITIFFLPTAIVFSKQSMQAQDNNDLGDPHFHDQLQDRFFLLSGYNGFTDGITGSNDPQYTTTTGSLPQSLTDETVPQLPAESSQPEHTERQRRLDPPSHHTSYLSPEFLGLSAHNHNGCPRDHAACNGPYHYPPAVQPAMPALVIINVRPNVKKQIVDHAKQRIARFVLTTFAMAGIDDEKAALVFL